MTSETPMVENGDDSDSRSRGRFARSPCETRRVEGAAAYPAGQPCRGGYLKSTARGRVTVWTAALSGEQKLTDLKSELVGVLPASIALSGSQFRSALGDSNSHDPLTIAQCATLRPIAV